MLHFIPNAGGRALAIWRTIGLLGSAAAQSVKPAPSAAAPAQALEATYAAAFDAWRVANDPLTAILVVGHRGKVVFARAHNANADGPSFIGSMSKAVTAACVATLIRDGKLSFTTPMREA